MRTLLLSAVAAFAVLTTAAAPAPVTKVSRPFTGAKVNGGTVTMVMDAGKVTLTLSSDFQVPDTPDPHWQVVDGRGQVFTLERLMIKGELPSPIDPPQGCAFHPRCPFANERCRTEFPELQPFFAGSEHHHACHAVEERRLPDLPGASDGAIRDTPASAF